MLMIKVIRRRINELIFYNISCMNKYSVENTAIYPIIKYIGLFWMNWREDNSTTTNNQSTSINNLEFSIIFVIFPSESARLIYLLFEIVIAWYWVKLRICFQMNWTSNARKLLAIIKNLYNGEGNQYGKDSIHKIRSYILWVSWVIQRC